MTLDHPPGMDPEEVRRIRIYELSSASRDPTIQLMQRVALTAKAEMLLMAAFLILPAAAILAPYRLLRILACCALIGALLWKAHEWRLANRRLKRAIDAHIQQLRQ